MSTGGDGWDMYAGGEVTACGGSNHNAMGVSGITNLSYKINNTGYYSWNNFWTDGQITPGYYAPTLSYNSFQNYGYNP
jgi:hypothetical protein